MNVTTFGEMIDKTATTIEVVDDVIEDPRVAETARQMINAEDLYRYSKVPHEHVTVSD